MSDSVPDPRWLLVGWMHRNDVGPRELAERLGPTFSYTQVMQWAGGRCNLRRKTREALERVTGIPATAWIARRFWSKVRKTRHCWFWRGSYNAAYGIFGACDFGETIAHRVAWTLTNGPIPDGLHVLHKCDKPFCVRPDHLFLGTPADNSADMVNKGRQAKGSAISRKLDEAKVAEMRRLYADGVQPAVLSERYGVTDMTVRKVVERQSWRHVP